MSFNIYGGIYPARTKPFKNKSSTNYPAYAENRIATYEKKNKEREREKSKRKPIQNAFERSTYLLFFFSLISILFLLFFLLFFTNKIPYCVRAGPRFLRERRTRACAPQVHSARRNTVCEWARSGGGRGRTTPCARIIDTHARGRNKEKTSGPRPSAGREEKKQI